MPIVGCPCSVCNSPDPRDHRTRVSLYIEWDGLYLLIDTSPDLRQQLLREKITRIDHVLFTHTHADHIFGLDDLRPIHFLYKPEIDIWGMAEHLTQIEKIFPYAFLKEPQSGPVPHLKSHPIIPGELFLDDLIPGVMPVLCQHGQDSVTAYRLGPLAYATDVSAISEVGKNRFAGIELLIVGALRYSPHPKHFSVDQAVELGRELQVKKLLLTHMGHELGYRDLSRRLPGFAAPAYDGWTIEL